MQQQWQVPRLAAAAGVAAISMLVLGCGHALPPPSNDSSASESEPAPMLGDRATIRRAFRAAGWEVPDLGRRSASARHAYLIAGKQYRDLYVTSYAPTPNPALVDYPFPHSSDPTEAARERLRVSNVQVFDRQHTVVCYRLVGQPVHVPKRASAPGEPIEVDTPILTQIDFFDLDRNGTFETAQPGGATPLDPPAEPDVGTAAVPLAVRPGQTAPN